MGFLYSIYLFNRALIPSADLKDKCLWFTQRAQMISSEVFAALVFLAITIGIFALRIAVLLPFKLRVAAARPCQIKTES